MMKMIIQTLNIILLKKYFFAIKLFHVSLTFLQYLRFDCVTFFFFFFVSFLKIEKLLQLEKQMNR